MTIDITDILLALLAVLGTVVTGALVPWLQSRIGESRLEQLGRMAAIAVDAAEQIFAGAGEGKSKFAYALDLANNSLRQRGIKFDSLALRAAIEAAVHARQ